MKLYHGNRWTEGWVDSVLFKQKVPAPLFLCHPSAPFPQYVTESTPRDCQISGFLPAAVSSF